ncbi:MULTISPECIES: hypothetical protein [unclassified Enterococcus]|uniref:hypothetical protein n=1 Tax=unclassified Enterococcus TaxID=2608891 RepID=UPI001A9B74EA|nr:hypothetical protein [Enterococcus sp. DIV1271a]MBO1300946.1 hypothetical protein [Enterococcus sp. DIV1271a]
MSFCAGCQANNRQQEIAFEDQVKEEIQQKAHVFTEKEYQSGEVPLHVWVKIEGKIIQADRGNEIEKGDRFILRSGSSDYQIFNEQTAKIDVGDEVIVYGEYYGFIKGILIERKETNATISYKTTMARKFLPANDTFTSLLQK